MISVCFYFQRPGVATDEGPRHNQTESKFPEKEFAMFIVVEHTITNPDAFFELAPKVSEAPLGIKVLQFFPSTSKDRAVCLWEAESVETLKRFLERIERPE